MAKRKTVPRPVQLQPRDHKFLLGLYRFDGVLAERQVRELYYPGIANSTFHNRMRQLRNGLFIYYPSRAEVHEYPVPEKVYWLGARGIAEIAAIRGIDVDWKKAISEHGQKRLMERLRRAGLFYVRVPHWRRLKHHIGVCDVRILAKAAAEHAGLTWGGWTAESVFRGANPDVITYKARERRGNGEIVVVEKTEPVYPDGFFTVSRPVVDRSGKGKVETFAYLVEVDRGTEPGPRVLQEKIVRGEAYLKSDAYRQRTGWRFGRFLLITTGPDRAANLKRRAETVSQRRTFYFGILADLTPMRFFTDPIWLLLGETDPVPLIPPST